MTPEPLIPAELGPRHPGRLFAALFLLAIALRAVLLTEPWSGLVPDFNSHFGAWAVGEPAQIMAEEGVLTEGGMPTLWHVELADGSTASDVYTHHPALYTQIIGLSLRVFGNHEASVRGVPAVFSLLSLLVSYRFMRKRFGFGIGLWVAAWMAVMPLFTWYGMLPWTEGVLVGIGVLQLDAYMRWFEGRVRRDFWIMMAWQFVAVMFDWSGTFMCVGIGVHALIYWRGDWRTKLQLLWLGVPIFMAVSVHALHMYSIVGATHQKLETASILGHVTELPTTLSDFLVHQLIYARRFLGLLGALLLGIGLLLFLGAAVRRRVNANDGLLFALLMPATLYIGLFPQRSYNHDFFLMISMPALSWLGGYGAWTLARLAGSRRVQAFAGLAVLSTALGIWRGHDVWQQRKSDQMPAIAEVLGKYIDSKDNVVLTHFGRGMALPFYAQSSMLYKVANVEDLMIAKRDVIDQLDPDRPVYFIYDAITHTTMHSQKALDTLGNPTPEEVPARFAEFQAARTKPELQKYFRKLAFPLFFGLYDYLCAHYTSEVYCVGDDGVFEVFDLRSSLPPVE